MGDLVSGFPTHPVVLFVIALGGLSAATVAVWRNWLRPATVEIRRAIEAAQGILELLTEVRDFMVKQLPSMLARLSAGNQRFENHEVRLKRLEEIHDLDPIPFDPVAFADEGDPPRDWPIVRPPTPRVDD